MNIPVFELKRQFRSIGSEISKGAGEVLRSGFYILGKEVLAFEKEFAQYCGAKYATGVASGTDALKIALKALGIQKGDEVITTPFTFLATAEAIYSIGAKVVFVDVDLTTYTINPVEIERKINKKTKAIVCVHLYGQPCNMQTITGLAHKYKLKLIEDCAQATGAEYKGKKVGTFGDAGCFSFYPTKNLGGCGDGGMIITDSQRAFKTMRMLREYGSNDRCHYSMHGWNSRLDELQAAILRVKLKYLDRWNNARREKALYYNKRLASLEKEGLIDLPREQKDTRHVFHLYVLRTKKRALLTKFLKSRGIGTAIHYPIPIHRQKIYKVDGVPQAHFPNAEFAAKQIITFPLFPELKKKEIDCIIETVYRFFKRKP